MLKIYSILYAYMLRLPFFLLVYSVVLFITREPREFFPMFVIFALLCALDVLVDRIRTYVVLAGFILPIVLVFFGMYVSAITILIFTVYKPEQYRTVSSVVLIACLFLITIITTLFIDPVLGNICIRLLVIATVAKILARQIQSLDRFLNSYHCRGVSRKTASSLLKRSYMLTITSLACFIAVGFIAHTDETLIPIPEFFIHRVEETYEDPGSTPLVEDEDPDVIIEETEESQTVLQLEPETETKQPNMIYPVVITAAALFTLFIIMLFIRNYRPETQFEDYEDIIEEAPVTFEKMSKKKERIFNFGTNYTVRRLFKRKVKEYMAAKGLLAQKSDTPKKLAKTISEWEDIGALELLYHKARYSGENVKRIELNMLKK